MKEYYFQDKTNITSENKRNKESQIKAKINEYFAQNKSLTKSQFLTFVKFIGLDEIWSTENGQKILWDKIAMYTINKNIIDYESALCGISDIFTDEEEGNEEIKEENNNLSDDNELLSDIDLQSLHIQRNSFEEEESINNKKTNEKSFEEFLNNYKNKREITYGIKLINEIYFAKYIDEENIEKDLENNDNDKNTFKINKNAILKEIKYKYKFINIPNEILKNYFHFISKDNTDNNEEIIIEKSLIKNINLILTHKDEDKKINIKRIDDFSNQNLINNEDISIKLDKLVLSDKNIINCINLIIDFNKNKNLIELIKEYIENYIINLKDSIYKEIKQKENEYKLKISNIKKNNYEEHNYEEENKKLKKQIESLIKENLTLSDEIEDINSKLENNNFKSKNHIISKNFESYKSPKTINLDNNRIIQKNKNKIVIPPLKLKDKMNINIENKNILKVQSNDYLNNNNLNKMSSSKSPNKLIEKGTNSFNEFSTDEIASSHLENSMNLNNITDQFLLDTTRLCNEGESNNNDKERSRYSLTNSSKILSSNKKKEYNKNNYLYSDISDNISGIKRDENEVNFEDDDIDLGIHKYNNNLTDRNMRNSDIQNNFLLNLDKNKRKNYNYNKTQSFYSPDINNNPLKRKVKFTNEDIFYGYLNKAIKNFFDFKYLFHTHKIKKLLYRYKENLIYEEFYSDEINVYSINTKKKKYILLITYNAFYFLKNDESLECIKRLANESLESIIVSTKNFNLLELSFNGGIDIIIETYQRIEILRFLQKIIDKGYFSKNLKISSSNNFYFHKRNGTLEQITTIKNKLFIISPNFENAQKIGVLLKYKENFFSASFQEKLMVLCSVGLMYFDENNKSPKIIPIVGTTIKFIVIQTNKKLYCLKMKTINEEIYIFGSLQKHETFDWLKELALFKKLYHIKMKQINVNFINEKSKEITNIKNINN